MRHTIALRTIIYSILGIFLVAYNGYCLSNPKNDDINLKIEKLVTTIKEKKISSDKLDILDRRSIARQILLLLQEKGAQNVNAHGIDAITSLLEDRELYTRMSAVDALAFIGPSAKRSLPALRKALMTERTKTCPGFCGFSTGVDPSDSIAWAIEKIDK